MANKSKDNKNKFDLMKNIGGNVVIWGLIIVMSITALQILSSDKKPIPVTHTHYLSLLSEGSIQSATITGKEFSGKLFHPDSLLNNLTNKSEYHNLLLKHLKEVNSFSH